MSRKSDAAAERAAKVAAMRVEQQRKERRTRWFVIGGTSLLVVGLAGATVAVINAEANKQAAAEALAAEPIAGVEETEGLSAEHVVVTPEPSAPGEAVLPPVGGDHDPVWQNCGVYDEPVGTSNAVHSLEHGAVWVTYRPGSEESQVAALRDLVAGEPYALLSPLEGLASPVVLTAWGLQLELDDANDPRAAAFLAKYAQGEQTPEPGASCIGGIGNPI